MLSYFYSKVINIIKYFSVFFLIIVSIPAYAEQLISVLYNWILIQLLAADSFGFVRTKLFYFTFETLRFSCDTCISSKNN